MNIIKYKLKIREKGKHMQELQLPDVENGLVDMKLGEREGETDWGSCTDIYALPCTK